MRDGWISVISTNKIKIIGQNYIQYMTISLGGLTVGVFTNWNTPIDDKKSGPD